MSKWKMPEPLGAGAAARGGEGDLLSAIPTATEAEVSATEVLAEEDAKLEDLEILKAALGSSKSSSSSSSV